MNIVFITDHPVPSGMAPSNRLLALATGINEMKNEVNILIINPTEKTGFVINKKTEGTYKGVHYNYLSRSTVIPTNFFKKILIFFTGLLHLYPELMRISMFSKIDAIIMLHTWSIYPLLLYPFVKKRKIVYLHERNEYPFLLRKKNIIRKIDYLIYKKVILKLFDGMIVITENLKNYYSTFVSRKARSIVIPITVESDRFSKNKKDEHKYIAYCGYLGGNKDGVYNLIESFAKICQEFNEYKLVLIGDSKNKNEIAYLHGLTEKLGIKEKVIFTGKIKRDDIPPLLDKAEVLALARPDTIQSKGGFPTKLGEYLSTGNPVVVTKVGDIPYYLKDGVNAYLADPDDNDNFALKLKAAIENKEQSSLIGQKGKELANNVFSCRVQGYKITAFIEQLKKECFL
jgi:glycosyltransferase involved in cell wall biosynthesis